MGYLMWVVIWEDLVREPRRIRILVKTEKGLHSVTVAVAVAEAEFEPFGRRSKE
jgi:hypothetical protein